jgi:hypothetical protein
LDIDSSTTYLLEFGRCSGDVDKGKELDIRVSHLPCGVEVSKVVHRVDGAQDISTQYPVKFTIANTQFPRDEGTDADRAIGETWNNHVQWVDDKGSLAGQKGKDGWNCKKRGRLTQSKG